MEGGRSTALGEAKGCSERVEGGSVGREGCSVDGEVFIDETEVSEDSDEERGESSEEVNAGPAAHTGDNDVGRENDAREVGASA